jgi:hypothetical protein
VVIIGTYPYPLRHSLASLYFLLSRVRSSKQILSKHISLQTHWPGPPVGWLRPHRHQASTIPPRAAAAAASVRHAAASPPPGLNQPTGGLVEARRFVTHH